MVGTMINMGAIVTGSLMGVSIGSRLPDKIHSSVHDGLGLVCMVIGMQMALETQNILIVLGALLLGGILGEFMRISEGLDRLGEYLQSFFRKGKHQSISEGFVTASLIFCIGPMAILGSIQDGLEGDFQLLTLKSMLDGFASVAFSASLGWGVIFSVLPILIYQGSITLFAGLLDQILTKPMITEMTATGGLIIVGISLRLLKLKEMRLANFLPALAIAPLIVIVIPFLKSLW
jgi:uncharacterized membrane protein YqgA involved in biofilm formation